MKKYALLIALLFIGLSSFAQNVGIGTVTPTHPLHLKSLQGGDPLKIEGIKVGTVSESSILVVNPTIGIVKHVPKTEAGTDDQNLTLGVGTPSTAIIGIESGTGIIFSEGNNIEITESGNTMTISVLPDGDGSSTNEIQTISETGNVVTLSNNGGSFTDTDTQLSEAQVDNYVNNNGYLTNVSAGGGLTAAGSATSPTFSASANNGLYVNAVADEIRLGGDLNQHTVITHGAYNIINNLSAAGNFVIRDNNSPLFAAMSNRRVGIATETPLYTLDVAGTITARDPNAFRLRNATQSVLLRNDDTNYWTLITDASDGSYNTLRPYRIALATGNVIMADNKVGIIHATGNVGIGTVNPTERLHVVGNGRFSSLAGTGNRMVIANAAGVLSTQAIPAGGGFQTISLSGSTLTLSNNGGSVSINDADSNPNNEIQTISETGNVVTLSNNGGSFTDTDTQLSEAQVDNYVNNNGYLTNVSAGGGLTAAGSATSPTFSASANNGLYVNAVADEIRLGGDLNQHTVITHGAYNIINNLSAAGNYIIRDNNSPLFAATSDRLVGIATENPLYTLDVDGSVTARNPNAFRLRGATKSVILRNDNNNYYTLITNSSDDTWNTLRPYRMDLATGNLYLANSQISMIHSTGNLGLGVANPTAKLDVAGEVKWGTTGSKLSINQGGSIELRGTGGSSIPFIDFSNDGTADYDARIILDGDNQLTVDGGDFSVKGTISGLRMMVTATGYPDYVFYDNYKLKPLNEVETFIDENGHLPGVPPEEEIIENGLDLSDQSIWQQEKIEELFLHMIEMDKRVKALEEENAQLKTENKQLKEGSSNH